MLRFKTYRVTLAYGKTYVAKVPAYNEEGAIEEARRTIRGEPLLVRPEPLPWAPFIEAVSNKSLPDSIEEVQDGGSP